MRGVTGPLLGGDRGERHPQRAQPHLVPRPHRVGQVSPEPFLEFVHVPILPEAADLSPPINASSRAKPLATRLPCTVVPAMASSGFELAVSGVSPSDQSARFAYFRRLLRYGPAKPDREPPIRVRL